MRRRIAAIIANHAILNSKPEGWIEREAGISAACGRVWASLLAAMHLRDVLDLVTDAFCLIASTAGMTARKSVGWRKYNEFLAAN